MMKREKRSKRNVLVIGCGLLGRKIAREFVARDYEVSVLDDSEEALEQLANDPGVVTLRGFPMDLSALRAAGIESCGTVAVVTSNDNLNITVAQIVRDYFGIQNVVARVSDPARESVFDGLGLRTVCPTNLAADTILGALTGSSPVGGVSVGKHTVSFSLRPVSEPPGVTLISVRSEPDEKVFGVLHTDGELELSVTGHELLKAGDRVIFAKQID